MTGPLTFNELKTVIEALEKGTMTAPRGSTKGRILQKLGAELDRLYEGEASAREIRILGAPYESSLAHGAECEKYKMISDVRIPCELVLPDWFIDSIMICFTETPVGTWGYAVREGSDFCVLVEDEGDKSYRLDWAHALKCVIERAPHLLDFNRHDAATSDLWVQYAAFGKIIFG